MSVDVRTEPEGSELVVGLLPREDPATGRDASRDARRTEAVTACVFADDLLDGESMLMPLNAAPDVRVLPAGRHTEADVVVVVAASVTGTLLDSMEEISARAENPRQRMVLVSGPLRGPQLARVVGCGVVSILPRAGITPRVMLRAVLASGTGGAVVPEAVTRWLLDEARAFQQTILAGQGLNTGGLTDREVDVLRLLAEGHDTGHVAAELNFSERTIKKIIQNLTGRFGLRNRTHAVTYALRAGAI
ncbi:response regulator transcription factor [Amycolatopsis tucumanensis]|uniref:Response regulator transcription factor n=1 Tax=Amycolatopsis tucumanensis TaxID=401106 RepID=A0ABP7JA42_9PSEU|nr:LuxR C-terminal-related transcriptional regulator [Amycolatopsis tucumanensis]MCF6421821.1 LuxR C-terminal-related transcriptional regulator [Amycolatopsis tucumanensis]